MRALARQAEAEGRHSQANVGGMTGTAGHEPGTHGPGAHGFEVRVRWSAGEGPGTIGYRAYSRDHEVTAEGTEPIRASAAPAFRGDAGRWNPEQLLLASAAQCHMLWYLHLAADAGITVLSYEDAAEGVLTLAADGGGAFTRITLHPAVTIAAGGDHELALALHGRANELCFIARSLHCPVEHESRITIARHE